MDLSQELHAVNERFETERARLLAEIAELKKKVEEKPADDEFEAERARLVEEISALRQNTEANPTSADKLPDQFITAEVARIEDAIREIVALIDNPETELSMVIRKNVEKAELDAYLKGILFSLGMGKPL
jgi:hypothetical protein